MWEECFWCFLSRRSRNLSLFGDRGEQSLGTDWLAVVGSLFVFGGFFRGGRAISLSGVGGVGCAPDYNNRGQACWRVAVCLLTN